MREPKYGSIWTAIVPARPAKKQELMHDGQGVTFDSKEQKALDGLGKRDL
jgi:hypothetical protein